MFIIRKILSFFIDTIQTILLAASVFLVIYIFLFRPFQVNGLSMFPNFEDKEYVLTDLISYHFQKPKLGDVVVFQAPKDTDKDFIKRIIGVPGDMVSIRNGGIYLNNQKLDENQYLKDAVRTYGGSFLGEGQTVTVPEDEYFVVGDNRSYSSDSREWGFVKQNLIIGKSLFVYWPPNRMHLIKNPFEQ